MSKYRGNKNSVRTLADLEARSKVEPSTGCRIWLRSKDKDGYGRVRFEGKNVAVHRLAWTLTNGKIPDGLILLHSCDNPPCFNLNHLASGTNLDNHDDSKAKGRAAIQPGAVHRNAKLTDAQVIEIRASDDFHYVIASRYGISRSNVSLIKNGRMWTHLPGAAITQSYRARGERAGLSKLTDAIVLEIRADKGTNQSIANRFGISTTTVSFIKNRKTWTHI
mgnify:CR=1 FL=1